MYYLIVNGYHITCRRTLGALLSTVAIFGLGTKDNSGVPPHTAEIQEGRNGRSFTFAPNVLTRIADTVGKGDELTIQVLGEAIDLRDGDDFAELCKRYKTERLVVAGEVLVSTANSIETAFR